MEKEFEQWMIKQERKSESTTAQYSAAISYISNHYSKQNNESIDLYKIDNIDFINGLVEKYGKDGKYKEIGNERSGDVRAAIKAYARFIEQKNKDSDLQDEDNQINYIFKKSQHFESNNKDEFNEWMKDIVKKQLHRIYLELISFQVITKRKITISLIYIQSTILIF